MVHELAYIHISFFLMIMRILYHKVYVLFIQSVAILLLGFMFVCR